MRVRAALVSGGAVALSGVVPSLDAAAMAERLVREETARRGAREPQVVSAGGADLLLFSAPVTSVQQPPLGEVDVLVSPAAAGEAHRRVLTQMIPAAAGLTVGAALAGWMMASPAAD